MNYLKWESDNGAFVVERMIGDIPANFVELSDPYLFHTDTIKSLSIISDIRYASFKNVTLDEARKLAQQFVRHLPEGSWLKSAIVIDDLQITESDRKVVLKYVEGLNTSAKIDCKVYSSLDEACDWVDLPSAVRREISE